METTVRILSEPGEAARAAETIAAFLTARGVSGEALHDIRVALDEILSNVVRHGYAGASGEIAVSASVLPDRVRLEVRDRARPFNPLGQPAPDLAGGVEARPVGGLGVHLVRRLMDRVEYDHVDGENRLVMERLLAGAGATDTD